MTQQPSTGGSSSSRWGLQRGASRSCGEWMSNDQRRAAEDARIEKFATTWLNANGRNRPKVALVAGARFYRDYMAAELRNDLERALEYIHASDCDHDTFAINNRIIDRNHDAKRCRKCRTLEWFRQRGLA